MERQRGREEKRQSGRKTERHIGKPWHTDSEKQKQWQPQKQGDTVWDDRGLGH